MKSEEGIGIVRINKEEIKGSSEKYYTIIWIRGKDKKIWIEDVFYENAEDTMFFLSSRHDWKILSGGTQLINGYIIFLTDSLLNKPFLKNLQINEMRILYATEVLQVRITPEIGKRLQAIIEMLEELMTQNKSHREEAVLALIHTFFIYCDGQCEFKPDSFQHNQKTILVYKFSRLLNLNISGFRKVYQYAKKLNVSPAYLNESTLYVLGINAKSLIVEQLVRQAKNELKFSDKCVKEIAYDMGFSSPDYFSSFCKKNTGYSPSEIKKNHAL